MRISDWSSDVCSSDLGPASRTAVSRPAIIPLPMQENERGFALLPLPFQPGVPAQDAFPAKLWARLRTRAMRETAIAPVGRRDPRGAPELRAQIAAQIAIQIGRASCRERVCQYV